MKEFVLGRGKSTINYKCDNGDVYDSIGQLYDDKGNLLYFSEYWNTEHTENYAGGKLSKGPYYGLCDMAKFDYKPEPVKIVRVFAEFPGMDLTKIKSRDNIPDSAWSLPSDIPNPNHDGALLVTYILLHEGGYRWNYSHCCQTALNYSKDDKTHEFDRFIQYLSVGEIIKIRLT